jgi:hypothetical protein
MHALQPCIDFEIFGKVSWAPIIRFSTFGSFIGLVSTSDTASCQVIDKTVIATYNHSVCFRMKKQLLLQLQREFSCAEQTSNCKEQ